MMMPDPSVDPMLNANMPTDPAMQAAAPPMDPMGGAPMQEMGEELADEGRGGDQIVGHLTPGEVVVPVNIIDDELRSMLDEIFAENGLDLNQYTVGNESNSINPETGMPEFRFKDPRRNWAAMSSYYGYTGTESGKRAKSSRTKFGISMADYNRFNQYMEDYRELGRAGKDNTEAKEINELGQYLSSFYNRAKVRDIAGEAIGRRYNTRAANYYRKVDPLYDRMVELYKKHATGSNYRKNFVRGLNSAYNPRVGVKQVDDRYFDKLKRDLQAGKKVSTNFSKLSDFQKSGPWQHAERYADTWDDMDEKRKREIFEDFMNVLEVERRAPYAGVWAGAAAEYGQAPDDGYVSVASSLTPYGGDEEGSLDPESQEYIRLLEEAPETIEYRTISEQESEEAFEQFRADQLAQQEAYLSQLRMQYEGEREAAEEARKKALSKQARVNRLTASREGTSEFTNAAAAEATGSVTDPRSMLARSYNRRASYGRGGTVSGFRAMAGASSATRQRPM